MKKRYSINWILFSIIFFNSFFSCQKDSSLPVSSNVKLFPKVKSIITANCTVSCHAPAFGYYDGMPVILQNDSDIVNNALIIKSAIADPITLTNKRMPQGGLLTTSDVDVIKEWYSLGGTINN